MKKGSILLALAVTLGILLFTAPPGMAAGEFVCSVDQVGPSGSTNTRFMLSDTAATPTFTEHWCLPSEPTRAKEMLAVALTAMSSGMNVWVYITNNPASAGTLYISQIHLTND